MQPVQPKGRKECGASQFFHMDGHRIGAAKGLAPHARFGGLLFACDLPDLSPRVAVQACPTP